MSVSRGRNDGQVLLFCPGSTLAHRLNPLTKFALLLWMISAAAVAPTLGTTLLIAAGSGVAWVTGVGRRVVGRLALTLLPLGIALIVVHGFLIGRPDSIPLGPLRLSPAGLAYAAQIATRIGAILTASLLFVTTTHPGDLLKSLDARGVSPGLSYLVSSPLLLLGPLANRAGEIRDAQRARGMDLTGSFGARIIALPALLIPLITLALTDLDHRAYVLTGRAFRSGKRRTVLDAPADSRAQRLLRRVIIGLAVLQIGLLWWPH